MSTKKYRPYFTLQELKLLRGFCPSPQHPLFKYLDHYILEIEKGYRKENHHLKPTIGEILELHQDTDADRYANNLMSPQEEKAYEEALAKNFTPR